MKFYNLELVVQYSNYLFIGNSVMSSDAILFFNNKRTWISAETAISLTNDILEENIVLHNEDYAYKQFYKQFVLTYKQLFLDYPHVPLAHNKNFDILNV